MFAPKQSAKTLDPDNWIEYSKRVGRADAIASACPVRSSSKFWVVGGVDVSGGLLRGVEIKVESLRSLLVAGIAFATPDDGGKPAPNGMGFLLYEEPRKEWLQWAPKIPLPAQK